MLSTPFPLVSSTLASPVPSPRSMIERRPQTELTPGRMRVVIVWK